MQSAPTEAAWTKRRRTPRVYHRRCAPTRTGLEDPEELGAAQPLHSLSTSAHTAGPAAAGDPGASAHAAGVTVVGALRPGAHAAETATEGDGELAAESQLDATDRTTHAAWSRQLGSSAQPDAPGKTASKEASAAPFHDQRSTAVEAGGPVPQPSRSNSVTPLPQAAITKIWRLVVTMHLIAIPKSCVSWRHCYFATQTLHCSTASNGCRDAQVPAEE